MAVVCHCEQVSDRAIKTAIASGASSVDDITAQCRAGGNCGGCTEALEALLANVERAEHRPRWRRRFAAA